MGHVIRTSSFVPVLLLLSAFVQGQTTSDARQAPEAREVANWPAPLLWTPPAARVPQGARTEAASTASAPLPFIAITPCRVADTRGNGFVGAYGPPSLVADATRDFTITGQCGIPVTAAAVSFNFAALNAVYFGGDLRVFATGGGIPPTSTLNYNGSSANIANAAVVSLGTGGAITVLADASPIDLIIDVNGYYDNSGLITGVTAGLGLSGGGTSGTVTLNLNFGGSGTATTASRSDHTHSTGEIVSGLLADSRLGGTYSNGLVLSNQSNVFTGAFTGNGSGLTNVNASLLGGQPISFFQTLTVPPPSGNTLTTLDTGGTVGMGPTVAIGIDGLGLISYFDQTHQAVKVAHCNDTLCGSATRTALDSGTLASLTIGADGLGLVTYVDASGFSLRAAHCSNVACSSAVVAILDPGDQMHQFGKTSVTIGADGLGLISYHDATNERLKVAHCSNVACSSATITTVDSTGFVGQNSSITTGADGLGLISYLEASSTGRLRVAHCSNITCSSATVTLLDASGDVGNVSSVTIGSDDRGLIGYLDLANGALKVAHCSNVTCSSATFATLDTGGVGYGTAVTIGSDGLGLISYTAAYSSGLKVAHCSNVACSSATLTTLDSNTHANFTSATIGADRLPLIVYHDFDGGITGTLNAAHCSNVLCAPYFRRR